jgi:hypothetical protein
MLLEWCVHTTNLPTSGRSSPHGYHVALKLPADAYTRIFTVKYCFLVMRE